MKPKQFLQFVRLRRRDLSVQLDGLPTTSQDAGHLRWKFRTPVERAGIGQKENSGTHSPSPGSRKYIRLVNNRRSRLTNLQFGEENMFARLIKLLKTLPRILLQVVFAVLAVLLYCLSIYALKNWVYPGWTWRGYLTDLKAIIGLILFLTPFAAWVWIVYRGKKPEESATAAIRVSLRSDHLAGYVLLLAGASAVLGCLVSVLGEPQVGAKLHNYVVASNWSHAQTEFARLSKTPIRQPILDSFRLYIETHTKSEQDQLKGSQSLRENRHKVQTLLEDEVDPYYFNSLCYAELSKAIHFVEDPSGNDEQILNDGIGMLHRRMTAKQSSKARAVLLARMGELELAAKNYYRAQLWFTIALEDETFPAARARIEANLGNTYAATNCLDKAVAAYARAELNYPEGRKSIFYSNYAYSLLLAERYTEARDKVDRAIRINPEDWYSYLNRGLIFEAIGQYEDALSDFNIVIAKSEVPDSKREASILAGRCAEIAGKPAKDCLLFYLQAAGGSTTEIKLDEISSNKIQMAELYGRMARLLRETNTYGTEVYIAWFEKRAKEIESN